MQMKGRLPIRLGTRGSPLAMAQAIEARELLMAAHGLTEDAIVIVAIKTTADRVLDRALKDIGGKGLFTKEIENSLLMNEIDIAVHCVKDMASVQPDGLVTDCFLVRGDPRDVLISSSYKSIADLPYGATVGTASLRRKAQVLHRRPDLKTVIFRGNVQARLNKLQQGQATATFLALAGLQRLGIHSHTWPALDPADMLPAVGQGALGIQRRANDDLAAQLLAPLNVYETERTVACERAFLATLEGSCETPIAGLAELRDGEIFMRGEILRTDGSECLTVEGRCAPADAEALGQDLARQLLARAPDDFFDWKKPA
ncbi:MAG: hydroxymethylbilane synthase [Mesorhizobium sp.]